MKVEDRLNIVFIGLPASGKTSCGIQLAQLLKRKFLDTDQLLLEYANAQGLNVSSVQKMYDIVGNDTFRILESKTISKLEDQDHLVIATGGGVLMKKENREIIKKNGYFVLLKVPLPILAKRIANLPPRPLFTGSNILTKLTQLDNERSTIFKEFADLVVDGTISPSKIALQINELLITTHPQYLNNS